MDLIMLINNNLSNYFSKKKKKKNFEKNYIKSILNGYFSF